MDKQQTKNLLIPFLGVIFVLSTLLYFTLPNNSKSYGRSSYSLNFDFESFTIFLFILSGALLTIASVLRAGEKFKESDLKGYNPEDFIIEETEKYTIAELSYIVHRLEELLKTDQVNSWQWQIKLKSATYRLNKLSKGAQHQISELNSEQITSLENKSHFLKLNDYNLNAKSDGSTVHSIKEKLSLYRQHREKGI